MASPQPACAYFPLVPGAKTPMIPAWQVVVPGQYQAVGSYGEALTAHDLVLDADPRNYPPGRDVLGEILAKWPDILPTRTVRTPSGGIHVYTTKDPSIDLRKIQPAYPGVDFLSKGHYAVGPGSQTIAGVYKLEIDAERRQAPQSFIASLERAATASVNGSTVSLDNREPFLAMVKIADPPVKGSRGITSYKLAAKGYDLALPLEEVYAILRDWWNPRGLPPQTDSELFTQCERAYKYAKNAFGSNTAAAKFTPDMAVVPIMIKPAPEKVTPLQEFKDDKLLAKLIPGEFSTDKHGNVLKTEANTVCALVTHSDWKGRFKFNQFAHEREIHGRMPWKRDGDVSIDKQEYAAISLWFSKVMGLEIAAATIKNAVYSACAQNVYHPVKDYFNSIQWDGIPRLDTMLRDTLGCEDTPLSRAQSKCTMMGIVKRVYEPGCKYDQVLVLEGPQGIKKSTWIKTLARQWYSSGALTRGDKDSFQNLRGRLVVELPEINATLSLQDFNWLKGVISDSSDTYRASYGETSKTIPRESVFIGTINQTVGHGYLKDEENRRFWPVLAKRINIELLERNLDQYYAEAVHRYRAGEECFISDPALIKAAKRDQDARKERDPIQEMVEDWCSKRETFKKLELLYALGYDGKIKQTDDRRINKVLRNLGWYFNAGINLWQRELEIDWTGLI